MSLINQMLRDLEKRRAGERHGAGGVFRGLTSTDGPRGRSWTAVVALGVIAAVLGATVAYLLWERRSPVLPVAASGDVHAPPPRPSSLLESQAAPVSPQPAAPLAIATAQEPAVIPDHPEVQTPAPAAIPPAATKKAEPPSPPAPSAASAVPPPPQRVRKAVAAAPTETAPSAQVEKNARPFTQAQLAAAAYQRGYGHMRDGKRDEAEAAFNEALRVDEGHRDAREALAGLLLSSGRLVEAGTVLEKGIALHPEQTIFPKLYARLLLGQQNVPKAVEVLEAGVQHARPDAEYLAFVAALHQRLGQHAMSIERYRQALALMPWQGAWWVGIGISLEGIAKPGDAMEAYKQAISTGVSGRLADYARERLKVLEDAS